ncbi:MAG: YCF48-related protein, partial [Methanococcaceae archaeon]
VDSVGVTIPAMVFNPKPMRNYFFNTYISSEPGAPEATGPEGSNYLPDPALKSLQKSSPLKEFMLTDNFSAFAYNGYLPPDPNLAVGPTHIVSAINLAFMIHDKTGKKIKTVDLSKWYSTTIKNTSFTDPKIIYDQFAKRWVLVLLAYNLTERNGYYMVSVSKDSLPTGYWYNYALPAHVNGKDTSGNWADYEGLGYDKNAIYITSNQFTFDGYFDYSKLRIIDKSQLYSNTGGMVEWADLWNIKNPSGSKVFTLKPSRIYDENPADYYLLTRARSTKGTYLTLYRLSNPLSNPQLNAVNVPVTEYSTQGGSFQLGSKQTIDANDGRFANEPVLRNGRLYNVFGVRSGTGGQYVGFNYTCIDINTNSAIEDITMGMDNYFYSYPALDVDKEGNVVVAYSRSGVNEYQGAYFTGKLAGSTSFTGSNILKEGAGSYYVTGGGDRNRWGDYMGAYLDPADQNKIWVISQYVAANNQWGTWIGGIKPAVFTNYVKVVAPDGGEYWQSGTTQNITWQSDNVTNVKIEHSVDKGITWKVITETTPAAAGSFAWQIPDVGIKTNYKCLVRITDVSNPTLTDISNTAFGIGATPEGVDWEVIASGVTANLNAIKMVDKNVSWVCGDNGVVIKSVNGGHNWRTLGIIPGGINSYSITALDSTTALVGTETGSIFRTSNGGESWIQVSININSFIDAVDFISPTEAYAIGDPVNKKWVMIKSLDGGLTWTPAANSLTAVDGAEMGFNGSFERIGNKIWVGTNKSLIYYSSNGIDGPWRSGKPSGFYPNIFNIAFSDTSRGVAFVNNGATPNVGKVYTTLNGGANWTAAAFPVSEPCTIGDFIDGTSNVWTGTVSSGIFHSTNFGTVWSADALPLNIEGVNALKAYPDIDNAIAVGNNGMILKSKLRPLIVSVKNENIAVPAAYSLKQNYPNPFNPSTTISFDLPEQNYVSIKVYNSLGQEMAQLVNDIKPAGSHQVTFNARGLSSGVYFYQLNVGSSISSNHFLLIRKMLYLK